MSIQHVSDEKRRINIVLNEGKTNDQIFREQNKTLSIIDKHFSQFIGLQTIKQNMKQIYATNVIHTERKKYGLATEQQVLHMIFMGNPGTGKTTIARHIATVLYKLNILTKGHFIEVE